MKALLHHLTTPMARKSSFFYFGSLFLSFARYLFHVLLLRFLTPDSYGEFLSYVSLLYLLTIPSNTVSLLVTRTVSGLFGQKDWHGINTFFYFIFWRTLLPALAIFLLIGLFSQPFSVLLKANPTAFWVLGVMTVFAFLGAIIRSYLSALQRFTAQIVIGVIELGVLLTVTFLLLKLEFAALSGVLGMLISVIVGTILTLHLISSYFLPQKKNHQRLKIRSFFLYSLIFSAGTMSLISTDVLLTRYYFDTHNSGLYSALSVIGRMIFFGLTPLSALILPVAASRYAAKKSTFTVYLKLILTSLFLGFGAVILFSLFPRLIVTLLSGSQYLTIVPLIPYIAVTMLVFALNFLTLSYLLAIEKNTSTFILIIFALLQPLLVTIYHQSLYQVVTLNLTLQICLFLSLLIYYKLSSYDQVRS